MGMRPSGIAFLVLANCQPQPVNEPEQLSPCEMACSRLVELACEEGMPDEEGNNCVTVCEETMAAGLVDLNPEEMANIEECP